MNGKFQIRLLKKQDYGVLLQWANDQETRFNSRNVSFINKPQHTKWFNSIYKERSHNPALICLSSCRARVGVIRFTRDSNVKSKWEIHFTVSPKYRGRGFAQPMLENALEWFHQTKPNQVIYAKVKISNLKSLKVLQSIGFKKARSLKTASGLVRLFLPLGRKNRSVAVQKIERKS